MHRLCMPLLFTSTILASFYHILFRSQCHSQVAQLKHIPLLLSSNVLFFSLILINFQPLHLSIHSSLPIYTFLVPLSLLHLNHLSLLSPISLSLALLWMDTTWHNMILWLLPHSPLALILIYALHWNHIYKTKKVSYYLLVKQSLPLQLSSISLLSSLPRSS